MCKEIKTFELISSFQENLTATNYYYKDGKKIIQKWEGERGIMGIRHYKTIHQLNDL